MHILYLNGDLPEQISEYIFLRHCELIHNEEILVDDTYYYSKFGYDEFELIKVFPNIKLKMLKDEYNEEKWKKMIDICNETDDPVQVPNILCDEGLDLKVVADDQFYYNYVNPLAHMDGEPSHIIVEKYDFRNGTYKVTPEFLAKHSARVKPFKNKETGEIYEHIFYAGVWEHELFAESIKKQLQEELEFAPFSDPQNIEYMENILLKNGSIAIYINSIEVLLVKNSSQIINQYSDIIRKTKRQVAKSNATPRFFIFSDDIELCKREISKFKINPADDIFYIKCKENDNDFGEFSLDYDVDDFNLEKTYRHIQLISNCNYLITYNNNYDLNLVSIISKKLEQVIILNKNKTLTL